MKQRSNQFNQYLYRSIENEEEAKAYLDVSLPLIGQIVMYFNGLEKWLDNYICETISERSDAIGLLIIHKMAYTNKVDLFKRFGDDFHRAVGYEPEQFKKLITDLKECARLRNLVVHADWENTDEYGYTYVSLTISQAAMEEQYVQFSEDALKSITVKIQATQALLFDYWEKRSELLYGN